MFLSIKKRTVLIVFAFLILLMSITLFFSSAVFSSSPASSLSIIIDAGHGGIDGGAVGKTGTSESVLNLEFAKELEKICKKAGFNVTMTRKDMNGLYSPLAQNKKRSEMEKRQKIINESDGKIVVSIHMNSYPLSSLSGSQVFYRKGNESGKSLGESIQKQIKEDDFEIRGDAAIGDYFVLNCTNKPAVLVECGFLSNEEEEKKLCDKKYRKKFCETLLLGILNFYSV